MGCKNNNLIIDLEGFIFIFQLNFLVCQHKSVINTTSSTTVNSTNSSINETNNTNLTSSDKKTTMNTKGVTVIVMNCPENIYHF